MSAATECPACHGAEVKSKVVTIDFRTGRRLSLVQTILGAILVILGVVFLIASISARLTNTAAKPLDPTFLILMLMMVLLFVGSGLWLAAPYFQADRRPLTEYRCKSCKTEWRTMDGADVTVLKVWIPGTFGVLMPGLLELGPTWLLLKGGDKRMSATRNNAARKVDFGGGTYTGQGKQAEFNGYPLVSFSSINGSIKNVVLEPESYAALRAWVPTATMRDLKTIAIQRELQGWGVSFIVMGAIQGSSLSAGTSVFNPLWGFALVLVGLLNMVVARPFVFVVNAVVIAIAAFGNLTSGDSATSTWVLLGVLQVVWAGAQLVRFWHYRQAAPAAPPTTDAPMPELDDLVNPRAQH